MLSGQAPARAHVLHVLPQLLNVRAKVDMALALREICAESWGQKNWWEVLGYLVSASQRESLPGAWPDDWSPSSLLRKHGFAALLQANSVLAAGPAIGGDSGDMMVSIEVARQHVAQGHEEFLRNEARARIPQELSLMHGLVRELQTEFRKPGNHHWGDISDLEALSKQLDLGVDRLQAGGSQCLCKVDQVRGDLLFFIAIWWDDPTHFRLAQLKIGAASQYASDWPVSSMPAALAAHYTSNACNPSAPIGAAPTSGVS